VAGETGVLGWLIKTWSILEHASVTSYYQCSYLAGSWHPDDRGDTLLRKVGSKFFICSVLRLLVTANVYPQFVDCQPDDGGDTFYRNVCSYKRHTASHPRRRHFSVCLYLWLIWTELLSNPSSKLSRSIFCYCQANGRYSFCNFAYRPQGRLGSYPRVMFSIVAVAWRVKTLLQSHSNIRVRTQRLVLGCEGWKLWPDSSEHQIPTPTTLLSPTN
jgi:hypothetical protein